VDVVVGEVVGPHRRGGSSGVQVDDQVQVARGEIHQRAILTDSADTAYLYAVHPHAQPGWIEGGPSRTDGSEHPAPVGIVAEDRTFEEVVARDRAGDLEGIGLGGRGADFDLDVVVGSLGVGDESTGEVGADSGDRWR